MQLFYDENSNEQEAVVFMLHSSDFEFHYKENSLALVFHYTLTSLDVEIAILLLRSGSVEFLWKQK